MGDHQATVEWTRRSGEVFTDNKYSRAHVWRFDGGAEVKGSSAPGVVPVPLSDPAGVDPEEAFIASLSSCHMLWFLALAAKRGFTVERYTDNAVAAVGKNAEGKTAVTRVTLRPRVEFGGSKKPTDEEIGALHHKAHSECFIANSVKSEVKCDPA